ncbi:AP-5 complex subunit zeta-1 [Tanacetum coccineum]
MYQIIFRDFEPSSILLDSQMNAKLFDFRVVREGPGSSNPEVDLRLHGSYSKKSKQKMLQVFGQEPKQRHWTSPGMEVALHKAISSPFDRLKQALKLAPWLLDVRKRLLNFILAAFHQSLEFVAILKAIEEHVGGGASHKDTARELFESLELLLYENLSSSRLGVGNSILGSSSTTVRRSSQLSLLSMCDLKTTNHLK